MSEQQTIPLSVADVPPQGLRIAANLALPLSMVTATQAIRARRRSGKSYTAQKLAEQMLAARQQVLVMDPTGAWYGLRSNAAGDGPGYPVIVFGGDHADAALDHRAGKALARAAVEYGFSAIFDLSLLEATEQAVFAMDFCAELFRLNRMALHLFIDEADVFAPQQAVSREEKLCVASVKRLVKMGGIRGIGCTMITQRPSVLNKDVLSQVDVITVLRMSHPLDLKAATDWLSREIGPEFAKRVEAELPTLPTGTAFVASGHLGIAERVEVLPKETFNSGATPKPGERRAEPTVLAAVDLQRLGQQVSEAARQERENSPEFLKAEVARLARELSEAKITGGTERGLDVGVLDELKERMEAEHAELTARAETAERLVAELRSGIAAWEVWSDELARVVDGRPVWMSHVLIGAGREVKTVETVTAQDREICATFDVKPELVLPSRATPPQANPNGIVTLEAGESTSDGRRKLAFQRASAPSAGSDGKPVELTKSHRKVLDALASLASIGVHSPERGQVSFFAGYSNPKSGGFQGPVGFLTQEGYVQAGSGALSLTAKGRQAVGKVHTPPTNRDLHVRLQSLLGSGEWKLLEILIRKYPRAIERTKLSEEAGYSNPKSGGFQGPLGRLTSLGLAEVPSPGQVRGTSLLFVEAR